MDNRVVIIKRRKKAHGGHHGGAWKVAYADFVTAMMALFLVLWIIAMLSADTRQAVADYFRSYSLFHGEGAFGGDKIYHLPGDAFLLQQDPGSMRPGKTWKQDLEERLKKELEAKLAEAMDQVFLTEVSGGVRIEIVERSGKAMFALGDARLLEHGEKLLEIIAGELGRLEYPLSIEGHTDAYPFRMGSYTNWELSVDRANAVRKSLEASGIRPERVSNVIGFASTDPIIRDDPYSELNRRVSIFVKELHDERVPLLSGKNLRAAVPAQRSVSARTGAPDGLRPEETGPPAEGEVPTLSPVEPGVDRQAMLGADR